MPLPGETGTEVICDLAVPGPGGLPQEATQRMQDAWNTYASRLRNKLEQLKAPTTDWTRDELIMYLRDYKRRHPRTIQCRLGQLRFMEEHPKMPVKMHGDRYTLVNSFYLYAKYRETVENKPATSLVNDYKAIRTLGDFLGIPREVWPTQPTPPETDERWLPTPEQVHELVHTEYTRRPNVSYENALIKALLLLDFGVGVRFPSEAHALKLRDFDPDRHVLVVTEPKKSGRRRTLLLEPDWLCCSKRLPSLANYLRWRKKLDPEGKQEAFFLTPDGKPFATKYAMATFLRRHVIPRFPWFYPYLGRHWCANARLIECGFDYSRVADWLGHESVNMTRREYDHNARLYERLNGKDWLSRMGSRGRPPKAATNR